jgi:hypothetical protein
MSRGILQLAVTGKLPLQLEYPRFATPLQDLQANMETAETNDGIKTSFLAGSFELIYGEY